MYGWLAIVRRNILWAAVVEVPVQEAMVMVVVRVGAVVMKVSSGSEG